MHNILTDTDLFRKAFAGVGMIGVYDNGRIDQFCLSGFIDFLIVFQEILQIFVMIVRHISSEFVHITTQNRMCVRIAGRFHFPSTIQEHMTMLCGDDRIHHDRNISAGRVLHTCRDANAAGGQTVLLVFDRTGTDGNVR